MARRIALGLFTAWVPFALAASGACSSTEIIDEAPLPADAEWRFPELASLDASCDAVEDRCATCAGERCCDQIAECDDACAQAYARFSACLFPVDGAWSGFSAQTCARESGVLVTTAAALIGCVATECTETSECGSEPRSTFTREADPRPDDFAAADFLEHYCNGCHNPGFIRPPGQWVTDFTTDYAWQEPYANPQWMERMTYEGVVGVGDVIACGVHPDTLPPGCQYVGGVAPDFFQGPEKFPPKAASKPETYGSDGGPMCPWGADGAHCPQPTPLERARMTSWVWDGMLEQ